MLEIFKYIVAGFIITITAVAFALVVLDRKPDFKSWRLYIGVLSSTVLFFAFNYIKISEVKSILNLFMVSILTYFIFKISISKSLFISIVHSILLLTSDILTMVIPLYVFRVDKDYLYKMLAGSILSNLIVCTIFLAFLLMIKKLLKKLFSYNVSSNKQIIIFSILTTVCVFVFFYIGFSNINLDNTLLISIFGMVVFVSILANLIKQKIENSKISEKYDALIEFMKSYEEVIDNQRIEHHENKNQLINIKAKLIDNDKQGSIIKYIDSILNEKTEFKKEKYSKLKYLPANGFKGMFYYKISKAEEIGINVMINISKSVEKSLLHELDTNYYKQLCRIIGVYLDNAIEASIISNAKLIGIEIYCNDIGVCIIISNSYGNLVNKEEINKLRFSTKGKGRGYGLSLVKNIINSNKRFMVETEVTDKLFIQKLIIKKQ